MIALIVIKFWLTKPFIALPSMLHVNDPDTNYHYHELKANQWWYWWSGESSPLNPRHKK